MRTLRLSLAGTAILILLGTVGAVGVSEQEPVSEPLVGMFTGACNFELTDACEAGVWTITDATGDTSFGRAALHSQHCPQTSGPSSTDGSMRLLFEDGSTLTADYAVSCEPLMPEGPALVTCTAYSSEVTGGTGRFEGATGTVGFDQAMVFFNGVDWPMVDLDWAGVLSGEIDVAAAPAG
jgi:hypothetical protein